MALYVAGACLVFSILLNAFLKDDSTPKTHSGSWLLLVMATILWPLVLPSIARKKFSKVSLDSLELADENWNLKRKIS